MALLITSTKTFGIGMAYAILATMLFACSIPLSVKFFLNQTSSWMLAGLLDVGAGLGIAILYGLSPKSENLQKSDLPSFLIAMLAGGILAPALFFFSLTKNATNSSMLLAMESPLTILLATLVHRETLTSTQIVSTLFIASGGIILSSDTAFSMHSLSAAMAALLFAISHVATGKIAKKNPLQIGAYNLLTAGIINIAINLFLQIKQPEPLTLSLILVTGFCCNGISYLLYIRAMQIIGSALTGSIFSLVPIFGAFFLVAFVKEPLTNQIVAAGLCMLLGIGFFFRRSNTIYQK